MYGVESIALNILIGLLALITMVIAAENMVNKSVLLSRHFNVSETFIGLSILSVGTSLPEIAAHLIASAGILTGELDYEVASATVIGTNIGSNIAQQTLIMGLIILTIGSLNFTKKIIFKNYLPMIGATLVTLLLGLDGSISRSDGFILVVLFGIFIWSSYHWQDLEGKTPESKLRAPYIEIILISLSIIVLLASCLLVLETTEWIVDKTGIGGSLIGVGLIALVTSLPEFSTALQGWRRGSKGISLGILIGSNVTNPLAGIGTGAIISTYAMPEPFIHWDMPAAIITALLLLAQIFYKKGTIGKNTALWLIILYILYIGGRIIWFSAD